MSRHGRRLALISLGLLVGSCLAPTIPMPPPARPEIQGPDGSGEVTLRGRVDARSEVYAENMRTGAIRGQHTADGAYRIVIGAEVGDRMQLFYRHMGDYSPTLEFVIPKPEPILDAGSLSAPK